MSCWGRLALLSVLVLLAASCARDGEEEHESGLSYQLEHVVQQAGLGDYDNMTWAMQVTNVNAESVVITSVEVVRADGLEHTESSVVESPNRENIGGIFPGFPTSTYADRAATLVQPLDPVVVPADGRESADRGPGPPRPRAHQRVRLRIRMAGQRHSRRRALRRYGRLHGDRLRSHVAPRPSPECMVYDEEVRQQLELPASSRQAARGDELARVAS